VCVCLCVSVCVCVCVFVRARVPQIARCGGDARFSKEDGDLLCLIARLVCVAVPDGAT
jgi:hypothetical protein